MAIPVQGHPNLYRDENSGAIINYDDLAYNQYVNSLNIRQNEKKEIDNLKNEVSELKSLLKQLLEKNGSIPN
jgi:hypothetical protein